MNGDEAAFPAPGLLGNTGLTKRELFAIMALHAILSQLDTEAEEATHNTIVALLNADVLIAALSTETTNP